MNSTPVTEPEYPLYWNYTTNQTMASSSCDAKCILYAVTNVIIFILGVAGNGLVIWIAGFKVKKSVVSTWYLSLAVSDFMFCSFLPFDVVYMVKDDWLFGLFMCKFGSFILFLNMYSSIFLLVIISVDRCVVVTFPVWAQNQRTARKASVIIVLAWIIAAALSTPPVVFLDIHYYEYELKNVSDCMYSNRQNYVADITCQFIFSFVIPFLVIFICYVFIIRKLKSNHIAKSKKPIKIMTILIATFVICWLPFHTVMMSHLRTNSGSHTAFVLTLILANAHSCLNPFLYAFMGKDIKEQCYALRSKIENAVKEEEDYKQHLAPALGKENIPPVFTTFTEYQNHSNY